MTTRRDEIPIPADDPEELPRRFCNEIQLFDLCDLERCTFRDGRYCTHADLLARFEALAEPEDRPARYDDEDGDDDDNDRSSVDREEDDDDYSVFDEEDDLMEMRGDDW